jgi:hypothetical protein
MRYIISILCLVCLCLANSVHGQEAEKGEKSLAVVMPPEVMLPVVAAQSGCPLRVEKAQIIAYVSGGGGEIFEVRNVSNKPIRSYTFATLTSIGTGTTVRFERLLLPGQTSPRADEGDETKIIPLTNELRNRLKLSGPTKGVIVFMVVRVDYADGTVYNDEPAYKAMQAYFENQAFKTARKE